MFGKDSRGFFPSKLIKYIFFNFFVIALDEYKTKNSK